MQPYAPQPLSGSRNISINLINQSKISLDQEIPLFETNNERNLYESISELYSIIIEINLLERIYTKNTNSIDLIYSNKMNRLLNQFNLILKDDKVFKNFKNLDDFCNRMGIDIPLAKKRISIGVPATVESVTGGGGGGGGGGDLLDTDHSVDMITSSTDNSIVNIKDNNNNKKYSTRAVAEATGIFITTMDALKLNYRTKDQLHPLLSDLITSINKVLNNGNFQNRSKLIQWLIKLNNLGFNESLNDDESREFLYDLDLAYKGFYECLE